MSRSYAFGEFLLEVDERRLLRRGVELPLPPKVFDTLLLLGEFGLYSGRESPE